MKAKHLLTVLLLVFVIGSVVYMIAKETRAASSAKIEVAPPADTTEINDGLIVYYFHGDYRCATCNKLESYAKEAIEMFFADQLKAGTIMFKPINTDESQNNLFIEDYELITKSVVLSKMEQGKESRFKNLEQIWEKVGDKDSYLEYIRDSVTEFLEETD